MFVGHFPRMKISFFYYQYVQKKYDKLQMLLHFCRDYYHLNMKKLQVYQMQYHIHNENTYQDQNFELP